MELDGPYPPIQLVISRCTHTICRSLLIFFPLYLVIFLCVLGFISHSAGMVYVPYIFGVAALLGLGVQWLVPIVNRIEQRNLEAFRKEEEEKMQLQQQQQQPAQSSQSDTNLTASSESATAAEPPAKPMPNEPKKDK